MALFIASNAINIYKYLMKKELGEAIKFFRQRRKLAQASVAEMLGVDKGNVSRYESGDQAPEFDRLVKLAEILDVRLSELFALAEGGEAAPRSAPLSDDFELLLADDQNRIAMEIRRLADIARAYRVKFGLKHVTDAHVSECFPTVPKTERMDQ